MTVLQLYRRLEKLIIEGHARKPVCVDKASFHHNCESDGVTILPVEGVGIELVLQGDDDGGVTINKDGSESYRMTCLLVGNARADWRGNIIEEPAQ